METIELIARCFEIPYTALFEEDSEQRTDYTQILSTLENELKTKLSTEIEACIKQAKASI